VKKRQKFSPDQAVRYKDESYSIVGADGADDLGSRWLVRHALTGEIRSFHASSLEHAHRDQPDAAAPSGTVSQLNSLDEEGFETLRERLEQLRPLLEADTTRADIERVAAGFGKHWATVYRWLKRLRENPESQVSVLARHPERQTRPSRLMNETVEGILKATIDEWVEAARKPSRRVPVTAVIRRVKRRCHELKLLAPHPNTVRQYIWKLSAEDQIIATHGGKRARDLLKGYGQGVASDYPYDVLQVDHTLFDLEVVSEEDPTVVLGRPWLTLATDVYSRMVASYYISFDPPGALAAGICIAEAMLSKDDFLKRHPDVQSAWPCEGKPRMVYVDNAREFRGRMLERAALEYGLTVQNRPAKQPQFAGIVERGFGTHLGTVHGLPGSTASNPQARTGQEGEPVLTLHNLERWFADYILDTYHTTWHGGVLMPPLSKWQRGVRGEGDRPARGVLKLERDPLRVRLDFLPLLPDATLQRYGVRRDYIEYFDETVQTLLNQKGIVGDERRAFIVKRDPRDISTIYLYDDEVDQYYAIPSSTRLPSVSLWEWNRAKRRAIDEGRRQAELNETVIFAAWQRMENIVSEAQAVKRRAVRSQAQAKVRARKRKEQGSAQDSKEATAKSTQTKQAFRQAYGFTDEDLDSFG
jgi:putative transposase